MAKAKKNKKPLVPVTGRTPIPPYESYNPLLEEDLRVNRRFSVGMVSSVLVNILFFGGAAAIASKVTPVRPEDQLPPAQYTLLDETPKEKPTPEPTPKPEKPTPAPKMVATRPTPPPEKEHVRPTPPPEREKPTPEPVKPTPEPVKVAIAKPTPEPVQPTPEPVQPTPEPVKQTPPPVKLDEPKQETTVANVVTPKNTEQSSQTAATQAARIAQVHTATTTAFQPKFSAGSTTMVQAPTNKPVHGPVGALATTAGPRTHTKLAEMTSDASSGAAGGTPSVNVARAAGMAGSGPAIAGARIAAATGASANMSADFHGQTATSGNASVISNNPTKEIRGPLAMTGPRLARSKVLTALGPTDRSQESVVQGGVVTAGQVVGTQGSTAARIAQVASGGGVVEARFEGVSNGIQSNTGGSEVIRGPHIAAGNPGLSGPRSKTANLTGLASGQMGAPGSFNSVSPGGGGVAGSGTGGGGGSSLRARGVGGAGNGGLGSGIAAQRSEGGDAVVSSRLGTPHNGPAHDGAAFGPTGPKGKRLSTTSVGDLQGPDGPAGDVNGTAGGMGVAGMSTGKHTAVSGGAFGSVNGFKEGTASQTVEGGTGKRSEGVHGDGTGPTETGSKIGRSDNAKPTRIVQPSIPDDLRTQQFQTFVVASVKVHADGSFDVDLSQGSGNSRIDSIVLSAMKRWKWQPAVANNVKVDSTVSYRFDFQVK